MYLYFTGASQTLIIFQIINYLKIYVKYLFITDNVDTIQQCGPVIFKSDNDVIACKHFNIYIENEHIITCSTFLNAFKNLYFLYYIFNISYNSKLSSLFKFIEAYFYKKKINNIKVLKLINILL